jgi:glycosyltransferase involved in cell wall biosynthesis
MTSIRVLHTRVVSGHGGGPEKTILNSPRFLADDGYDMLLAYMRDPKDPGFETLLNRAQEKSANLVGVDDRGALDRGVYTQLRDVCSTYQPHIWHGHDYKSNLLGPLVRRKVPMRLVTTLHGWVDYTWKTPLYYAIDRWSLRFYDHVVCVSTDLYDAALKSGCPEKKVTFIPNAIDIDEFKRTLPAAQSTLRADVASDTLVLGAIGRLSPEKGFDNLIRAVCQIVKSGVTNLQIWIIGEGRDRERLEALIDELRMGAHVRLLGQRSDMLAVLEALDLFVLSSIREGLPNVVLEAMAMEIPIVATRVGSVPDVVEDGATGRLIEPGNVSELIAGIENMLANPVERERQASAARSVIEERYSFAVRMQRMKRVYEHVLAEQE